MPKKIQCKRRILSAYDAWYFLRDHPKLNRRERNPLTPEEAEEARKPSLREPDDPMVEIVGRDRRKHYRVIKDKGGNFWQEWRGAEVPAVDENLDIHYATVDERGRVNKDDSKNTRTAVWLELGPVLWGYHTDWEPKEGARAYKMHIHDVDLDCGAPTFDEALIKLARKVQRKYGDYPVEQWQLFRPVPRAKRKAS
jgi:hypothetical protein